MYVRASQSQYVPQSPLCVTDFIFSLISYFYYFVLNRSLIFSSLFSFSPFFSFQLPYPTRAYSSLPSSTSTSTSTSHPSRQSTPPSALRPLYHPFFSPLLSILSILISCLLCPPRSSLRFVLPFHLFALFTLLFSLPSSFSFHLSAP